MQKLYCYVDESGQDATAKLFVVVAIVSEGEQVLLRQRLEAIEHETKVGQRKWHKSRRERRLEYLRRACTQRKGVCSAYYGSYRKPLPYFLPLLDTLEKAIQKEAATSSHVRVYIDGIDRKKALEMTNALRVRGISIDAVKSRRDESEPFIRFADRLAGCLRVALHREGVERQFVTEVQAKDFLIAVTEKT